MGNYASDFIWNIASLADLGAEGHAEMMGTLSENAGKMLKVRSECVGPSTEGNGLFSIISVPEGDKLLHRAGH